MNDKEYTVAAKRTLSLQFNTDKVSDVILHGVLGICTEAGELADPVKKALFYGRAIDKVNLVEEMGDIMWYLAVLADELGVTLEDVKRINIAKLKERFGDKFTTEAANVRDLKSERDLLERKLRGTNGTTDMFEGDDEDFVDQEVGASRQVIFTIAEIQDEKGTGQRINVAFEPPLSSETEFDALPENEKVLQNIAARVATHIIEKMGE